FVRQTEASGLCWSSYRSLENPLCPAQEHAPARCMFWTFYRFVVSLFGADKVTSVPHAVGLVCLSAGLMFVIAALLWFPIIKDKLKREGFRQK
uniref:Uncharacterized protein n=1 Tax=Pygocentrus nattereri TaxID=42514 RepID=A0AAR2LRP1_PYGNA